MYINKKVVGCFLLIVSWCWTASSQCAMCRAVLESEEGQTAAKSINDGIVYLMAIPYVLVFGFGYFIYKKFYTSKK